MSGLNNNLNNANSLDSRMRQLGITNEEMSDPESNARRLFAADLRRRLHPRRAAAAPAPLLTPAPAPASTGASPVAAPPPATTGGTTPIADAYGLGAVGSISDPKGAKVSSSGSEVGIPDLI